MAFPMHLVSNHLIAETGAGKFLLDTGSPVSFARSKAISIHDRHYDVPDSWFPGVNADVIANQLDYPVDGLIGNDILGQWDTLLDAPGGSVSFEAEAVEMEGVHVPLDFVMGVPRLVARIGGDEAVRLVFDTGAHLSYLDADLLPSFPEMGEVRDFYPMFGEWISRTHRVPIEITGLSLQIQCGKLPDLLSHLLEMTSSAGVLGSTLLLDRQCGFFPRRKKLVLARA